MHELDFATEGSIAQAFEQINSDFEEDIADRVEGGTAQMFNVMRQIDAQR